MQSEQNKFQGQQNPALAKLTMITLGNGKVGKTSILRRYINNQFKAQHIMTVGVQRYNTTYKLKDTNQEIKIAIWDSAGQQNFRCLVKNFYKRNDGIILCYDVCNRDSFNDITSWAKQIQQNSEQNVKIILVGNKIDKPSEDRVITSKQGKELALKHNYKYFEVSAKTGQNIDTAISYLIEDVYKQKLAELKQIDIGEAEERKPRLTLGKTKPQSESQKCKC